MTDTVKEYGTALFMLAKEENKTELFARNLATVEAALAAEPDYAVLLSLPNIAREERVSLIDEAFASSVDDTVLSFLKLLCEEGGMRLFADAKAEYDALFAEDQRITHATVTSAVPLTDEERQAIVNKLQTISGHTVEAHYLLDESLLGGVVVEMNGTVYDSSLKRQMRHIKDVIET